MGRNDRRWEVTFVGIDRADDGDRAEGQAEGSGRAEGKDRAMRLVLRG